MNIRDTLYISTTIMTNKGFIMRKEKLGGNKSFQQRFSLWWQSLVNWESGAERNLIIEEQGRKN